MFPLRGCVPLNLSDVLSPWRVDCSGGIGPQGPQGPSGAEGPQGPQGSSGGVKLGSGTLAVPHGGSARVGPFTRTAGSVPEAWVFPTTHGGGNTWAMSTEAPGSSLDYVWQFIDNAEVSANDFSLIIFNDSGTDREFDYVIYQKAM